MEKTTPKNIISKDLNDDEIDIIGLLRSLWKERLNVIRITVICMLIGLFTALTSASKYKSTIVIKPSIGGSKSGISGNLGGLAAMAGINLGQSTSSGDMDPSLYPNIIESYQFQSELMESSVYVKELNSEVSLKESLTDNNPNGFRHFLNRHFSEQIKSELGEILITGENNIHKISNEEYMLMKLLKSKLAITVDEKKGIVSLSATMNDNLQAAQLVTNAQELLQKKVIAHRLKKIEDDLSYIEARFFEKKKTFEQAQFNLAIYRDANKNINSSIAQTEIERLESEYQLAFSLYTELAKQYETQKLHLKKNTPVFLVLKKAVVPLEKINLSRVSIFLISILIGLISGIGYVLIKDFALNLKKTFLEAENI